MPAIVLAHQVDWEGWRAASRTLALDGVPPEDVIWSVGDPDDLFATGERPAPKPPSGSFTVPRALVSLAETAIQSSDPERFARLYRLIWRAHGGEKHLLEITTDPASAGRETRALLARWNRLHAVRTVLGALAVIAFLDALTSGPG